MPEEKEDIDNNERTESKPKKLNSVSFVKVPPPDENLTR